jgi:hypothetical protein
MTARIVLGLAPILILIFFLSSCASPRTEVQNPSATAEAVLIAYARNEGGDGIDDMSACLLGYSPYYRFVLFGDGRLVRFDKTRYLESKISQAEIDKLLSEIDATGFSSLTGDGDQYIQNAPAPSFKNTWEGSITIDEKTIPITAGQTDYLTDSVIKTLDIIENYKPKNLQPYTPESVALWVYREEDIRLGLASPTPEPPVLEWAVDEIDLKNLLVDLVAPATSEPKVVSGDSLAFLMQQLKHVPVSRRVEQNGQNYLVVLCPNFPK